jgi:hypothetical protein
MLSFQDFAKRMKELTEELLELEDRSATLERRSLLLEDQAETDSVQRDLRSKIEKREVI